MSDSSESVEFAIYGIKCECGAVVMWESSQGTTATCSVCKTEVSVDA